MCNVCDDLSNSQCSKYGIYSGEPSIGGWGKRSTLNIEEKLRHTTIAKTRQSQV